jgi:DNA-binding SARP family transcriptional activator/basic membrane lipoprotein Med (substrate-binding protein (PBP1-ABC) superfamily)
VTSSGTRLELRVLGPLEALRDGVGVPLGGAKQRALLAVLLLRAGNVVPVERLIDDVWGHSPPPSAAHSLEAYVSRLRQLFAGGGLSLVRRGAGYCLELEGALLDAWTFERLANDVADAEAAGDRELVAGLAAAALALWRGPALADVALTSSGRLEAERLEERRLRLLEQRFDAELSLGRDEELVGELQVLVGQNPYRERFVGQLMLALYRSGRQADALEAYEKTRVALDEDLGLQPSAELQQLSGRIVRQDPELRRPAPAGGDTSRRPAVRAKARRVAGLVLVGATTAAAMAFTAQGSAPRPARQPPAPDRVALVLPQSPGALSPAAKRLSLGVRNAAILYELHTRTFFMGRRGTREDAGRTAERIQRSGSGVAVVLGDDAAARALAQHVRRLRATRFVFVDASLTELSLESAPNAVAVRFADDETSHLVGYMSGLVERKDDASRRVDAVSVVAGTPTAHTRRQVAAFTRGVRKTAPDVDVRVDYAGELVDPTPCERLANRQIDDGADVVFAVAGRCGLGALAVARSRNVWGIGTDDDGVSSGADVLAVTYKEWERVTIEALEALAADRLPMGRDLVRGLDDDYAVGLYMSSALPAAVQSAVIDRCSEIRRHAGSDV